MARVPDSPKCPTCFEKGILAQTYKIAGRASFKCQLCKLITNRDGLDSREFEWKENFKNWEAMIESRMKDKPSEVKDKIRKQIKDIETIVNGIKK